VIADNRFDPYLIHVPPPPPVASDDKDKEKVVEIISKNDTEKYIH
jgi:hypothetical protein